MELEQGLFLLASWGGQVPAVLITSLVESAVLSGQGQGCDPFFDALPRAYEEEARRHAFCLLRRLEQGPAKSNLIAALVRRWPLDVLGMVPELATDKEKARAIQQVVAHETFRESHLNANQAVLLQLTRGLK